MKTLSIKIPKRIAGVKLPKVVRKGPINDFVNSSGGQVLIAEALLVLARSYAVNRVDPRSAIGEFIHNPFEATRHAAVSGKDSAKHLRKHASHASSHLTYAFGEGVQAFREALNRPQGDVTRSSSYESKPHGAEEASMEKKRPWTASEPASAA